MILFRSKADEPKEEVGVSYSRSRENPTRTTDDRRVEGTYATGTGTLARTAHYSTVLAQHRTVQSVFVIYLISYKEDNMRWNILGREGTILILVPSGLGYMTCY